jgi:glycosyltransferase A (GT-A) superfamily protein (DUF2064 family)
MTAGQGAGAVALVLAAPPLPGARPALAPLLGAAGAARLQGVLLASAARWALDAAPGAAVVAVAGGREGIAATRAVVPAGVEVVAQDPDAPLRARVAAVAAGRGDGPLLVAGTSCPALGPGHTAMAFQDLAEGCDAALGPMLDGHCYLAALRDPGLLDLPPVAADPALGALATGLFPALLATAQAAGLVVGRLRFERALRTPGDAAALLADPIADPALRAALG